MRRPPSNPLAGGPCRLPRARSGRQLHRGALGAQASASIPAPPQGFVPTAGHAYRGVIPKKEELAVLPEVIAELAHATSFEQIFGQTVPPLDVVQQTFEAAQAWSSMRAKTSECDLYCRTQEGLAWRDQRALIACLKPAFELAVKSDASIAGCYRSLARFLAVNAQSAKRGAATREANRKAQAEGEPPRTTK